MTRGNAIFFLSRIVSLLTIILKISWHQLCDVGRSEQFRRRSNDHPQFQGIGIRPQYSSMEPPCIMATNPSSTAVIKISWAAAELASLIKNHAPCPAFIDLGHGINLAHSFLSSYFNVFRSPTSSLPTTPLLGDEISAWSPKCQTAI